jgi:hypothetical protein
MSIRISVITAAAAALAAATTLSACGSATPSASKPPSSSASSPSSSPSGAVSPSPAGPPPPGPIAGAPIIRAVNLDATFSPDAITVAAGMKFQVIVSQSVDASGLSLPAHCSPGTTYAADDGMLSVTCPATGGYLYTADRAGTAVLSATIRPHCSPGSMCPQWIKEAALTVTITG